MVTVLSDTHAYELAIAPGVLAEAGAHIRGCLPGAQQVLIVTEARLEALYGKAVVESCRQAGFRVTLVDIPGGESHKTLTSASALYDVCLAHGLTRRDALVALGGGIIGDLVGFVAATWQRGLPFVQCPTTLLAQVDASVGGKVAVNYQAYKNMVGAFYQPALVLIDPETLKTLPKREFACGMAEVIKYALIQESVPNGKMLPALLKTLSSGVTLSPTAPEMTCVIEHACQLKAWVVAADTRETAGVREILNLGHTFGHAFEHLSGGAMPHGEAVALGMIAATKLAIQRDMIAGEALAPVEALCQAYGLPTTPPAGTSAEALLDAMGHDKKRQGGATHRLVLPEGQLGRVCVVETPLSPAELAAVLGL